MSLSEEGGHLVLLDHTEELGGVRGAHRLPLVHHRRVPGKDGQLGVCLFVTIFPLARLHINLYTPCQQGRVAGVLMAHDPTQVGGSPPGLSRLHPVDRLHRPLVHHRVTSHRVLYTLRLAWRVCVVRMYKHFLPPSTKLLVSLDHPFQHPKNSSKATQCFY